MILNFLSSLDPIVPSSDENASLVGEETFSSDHAPQDRFMDTNNDRLLDIDFPSSRSDDSSRCDGLPAAFVRKICLNRIFLESYDDVDFDQALAGLDYLRNLETKRRNTLRYAAQRLGLDHVNWEDTLAGEPEAKSWIELTQKQELQIERYYADLFVDLRVWVGTVYPSS